MPTLARFLRHSVQAFAVTMPSPRRLFELLEFSIVFAVGGVLMDLECLRTSYVKSLRYCFTKKGTNP